jgi:hypothetical protein
MMMREPDLCGGYRVHRTGGKKGFAYSAAVRALWTYPLFIPQSGASGTQKGGGPRDPDRAREDRRDPAPATGASIAGNEIFNTTDERSNYRRSRP